MNLMIAVLLLQATTVSTGCAKGSGASDGFTQYRCQDGKWVRDLEGEAMMQKAERTRHERFSALGARLMTAKEVSSVTDWDNITMMTNYDGLTKNAEMSNALIKQLILQTIALRESVDKERRAIDCLRPGSNCGIVVGSAGPASGGVPR